MWWWVATIAVWLFSAAWIIGIMVGVARRKDKALHYKTAIGVAVHGFSAIIVLVLLFRALGS